MLLTTDHSQRLTGAAGIDRRDERAALLLILMYPELPKSCHRETTAVYKLGFGIMRGSANLFDAS